MSPHVLVVDDDDDVRLIAQLSLARVAGWEVTTAAGGEEALELLRTVRPDAVVMDVMMPGLDGPATFARLQDDPELASIPVVMLTAKARPADRVALEQLGVAGVLTKPFDPMTLATQVADTLGWSA